MEVDKECLNKAVAGFLGSRFYITVYFGDWFFTTVKKTGLLLDSRERINELSEWDYDQYITEVSLDDVEDIFRCKMYATYKGNEYEVLDVAPEFENMNLKARRNAHKCVIDEDLDLGFEYVHDFRMGYKTVTLEEVDDIRVEKHSVKEEFLQKYRKGE